MSHVILDELKEALVNHDWYYGYSDDYNVYSKGQRSWGKICDLRAQAARAGLQTEADQLYERYVR